MANITRTPAKTYKAIIRRRGWPTVIKTFRTKGDAKDWARQVEDQMVRGTYIDRVGAERLSLKEALDRYLREVTPTKRPTTARREHLAAQVLTDRLGDYSLAALSPDLIANYRDERLGEGKSPDTVRIELALLSHVYTIAIREWHLGLLYNPVANIRKPTPGRGRNRRLSPDEERRLLKACRAHPNPMLGWLVRAALHTGMRAGELLTLQREQVDLKRRIVRLEQTKNGSARTVPLSRAAVATLREALEHPARPEGTSLIFPGEPGKDGQRRPYQYHRVWGRMLKRARITGLRFHDLRHEAVSRLVEGSLSDQEVSAISGHRTMQMLKRYTHLRAEDLVSRLDQAMPHSEPTQVKRPKRAQAEASRAA